MVRIPERASGQWPLGNLFDYHESSYSLPHREAFASSPETLDSSDRVHKFFPRAGDSHVSRAVALRFGEIARKSLVLGAGSIGRGFRRSVKLPKRCFIFLLSVDYFGETLESAMLDVKSPTDFVRKVQRSYRAIMELEIFYCIIVA